ncbi:ATP-dependent helicase [Elizabethkingia anophelis]|nr:ATP-dependent helicase [Elizabethkingia anophelis]MCT3740410.1 ATP-dependent helicase [Elizabethkingia anophelis]MCT3747600.1 ATP-dependent helicase [Elizabethkingia anophelis]MCT3751465.1 ATP-dependent helicase [Elizabethkingia anophelis]MCT3869188.1 ATP-dependent helicase [Elizabethkingia anophelis]
MQLEILSDTLIDTNHHFKVSAGPGAGKTFWIVSHIKNVIQNSTILTSAKKILCITYTNTAAETIQSRLGTSSLQVEVLTIHSFLYTHIIKPYLSFISDEYDFDVSKLNGHDDTILSNYQFLQEWKEKTGQKRIKEDDQILTAFQKMRWRFDNNDLIVKPDYPIKINGYSIKNDSYFEYKKMAWKKGVLHHDDVLFFSLQILKKFPFVSKIISSKFPYIFIDEFQDSNPIQISIVKKLARLSTVGVIGDVAQSIYEFQGAEPGQFQTFNLVNNKNYYLNHNRRSSNEIIDFLNKIRNDFKQQYHRNISFPKPILFVGDMVKALKQAKINCPGEDIHTLSWDNLTSNAMKAEINGSTLDKELLNNLRQIDSNFHRGNLIFHCINAIALAKEAKFKEAINILEKYLTYKNDKFGGRKKALRYLTILLKNFDKYKGGTLLELSNFVRENLDDQLTKVTSGKVKTFYESHSFQSLLLCVNIAEDNSLNRTIHKAKGAEFTNVLLIIKDQKGLEFIYNPDLANKEEHRLYYVAVSRAQNRLFICVPTLDTEIETLLQDIISIQKV